MSDSTCHSSCALFQRHWRLVRETGFAHHSCQTRFFAMRLAQQVAQGWCTVVVFLMMLDRRWWLGSWTGSACHMCLEHVCGVIAAACCGLLEHECGVFDDKDSGAWRKAGSARPEHDYCGASGAASHCAQRCKGIRRHCFPFSRIVFLVSRTRCGRMSNVRVSWGWWHLPALRG